MMRVGDTLKSIGTIYQALLINIQERFLEPSNEKDFGSNNEIAVRKRMELLTELIRCFYHYYAEGYTLTQKV